MKVIKPQTALTLKNQKQNMPIIVKFTQPTRKDALLIKSNRKCTPKKISGVQSMQQKPT